MDIKTNDDVMTSRLEWIEPEMHQLDVRETALNPHTGGDGQASWPDCSRS